ncbi:hypothetical protein DM02DRAFT_615152 [Periconia macrospinosa]|uniref:Integral membrane protein n=1 Tax=Periconia macrospinosa TaxID=97972 RepID=A0A2V1DN64_9PLEO|nr:hypothetical protein DM02DRAFT_615152 [Periconia macrospinosa]
MNASATMRNAFIGTSRLSFCQANIGGNPSTRWPNRQPADPDFEAVDYVEYKASMRAVKIEEGPIYDNTCDVKDRGMGKAAKLGKMFTQFPIRDPPYLVSILFFIGSLIFIANSVFGLIPFIAPQWEFPHLMDIFYPVTIFVAASTYFAAGIIDMLGAFNAENGIMEIAKNKRGVPVLEHQPALLGSEEWSWSTCGRFRKLMRSDPNFQAGFFMFCGGMVLNIGAYPTIPGLMDPNSAYFPYLAFVTLIVGGWIVFVANSVAMFAKQKRWWRLKVTDAGWQGRLWFGLGGIGFMLTGVFLLLAESVMAAWVSLAGNACLLLGSIIVWYDTMEVV